MASAVSGPTEHCSEQAAAAKFDKQPHDAEHSRRLPERPCSFVSTTYARRFFVVAIGAHKRHYWVRRNCCIAAEPVPRHSL